MRFLLDTNVISEAVKRDPERQVADWLRSQSPLDLALSVLTLGEIAQGVHAMSKGRRRDELESWLEYDLPKQFLGRILAVDEAVALEWGRLTAAARASGRPLPVVDGLLLATAARHELTLVTRNERDCGGRGIPVLNPWSS